jgi:hypothetical protein
LTDCIAFIGFTIDAENYSAGKVADTGWIPQMPQ